MRKPIASAIVAMTLFAPGAVHAQQVGDWVLSRWQSSAHYFPGVIIARSGNTFTIEFDDSARETRLVRDVRPYNWTTGSRIECRWTDGNWYAARILMMGDDGTSLLVRYVDDGVEQRTKTGSCRSTG